MLQFNIYKVEQNRAVVEEKNIEKNKEIKHKY